LWVFRAVNVLVGAAQLIYRGRPLAHVVDLRVSVICTEPSRVGGFHVAVGRPRLAFL